jgi:hypothetical protein
MGCGRSVSVRTTCPVENQIRTYWWCVVRRERVSVKCVQRPERECQGGFVTLSMASALGARLKLGESSLQRGTS